MGTVDHGNNSGLVQILEIDVMILPLKQWISHRELKAYRPLQDCRGCNNREELSVSSVAAQHYDPDLKDVSIVATYSDHYGNTRLDRVKMGDLSSSWVLDNLADQIRGKKKGSQWTYP